MMFFSKKPKLLKPGTPAPDFAVNDHTGALVKLADLRGKRILLWFYPKADTPGCTIEGKGLRDRATHLSDDQIILGVSFDSVQDNCAFAEKYGFPYRLLCDTTRALGVAYGACTSADAKHPERITYVIDKNGAIEWAEKVTDIEAHIHAAMAHLSDA